MNKINIFKARGEFSPVVRGLESGLTLVKRSQYYEALDQFRTVLSMYPDKFPDIMTMLFRRLMKDINNLQLRVLISELYILRGLMKDAMIELEEAFDLNPEYTQIYFILSRLYSKNTDKAAIASIFERAFQLNIYDSAVLDLLPKIYLEQNDLSKGINFYQCLIKKYPDCMPYYKSLAELYIKQRDFDNAIKLYQQVYNHSPETKSELILYTEEMIHQSPTSLSVRFFAVDLYLKSCNVQKALSQLQDILRLDKSKVSDVIRIYKDALRSYPRSPDIILDLSKALVTVGEYTEAVDNLRKIQEAPKSYYPAMEAILHSIIAEFPYQIMALMLLADLSLMQHKYADALNFLDKLIDVDDQEINEIETMIRQCMHHNTDGLDYARYLLARICFTRENFDECIVESEQLFSTEFDMKSRFLIADVYEKTDRYSFCYRSLFQTLNKYPFHLEVHDHIKRVRETQIETEIARKLVGLEQPGDQDRRKSDIGKTLSELGLLYLRKGDIYKALEHFQKIPDNHNAKIPSQVLIGRCFMELDRFDLSINQLVRTLERTKNFNSELSNQIRYLIGMNYINTGRVDKAMTYLNNILEYNVKFPRINTVINRYKEQCFTEMRGKTLSICRSMVSDKQYSLVTVPNNQTLIKAPTTKTTKKKSGQSEMLNLSFAYVNNNQGVEYLIQENFKAAEDEFNFALQMDPSLNSAHCNLAILCLLRNDYDKALHHIRVAQTIDDSLDTIYLNTGTLFFNRNELSLAKDQFKQALKLNPENYLALLNLGDLYYEKHDLQRAFEYWKQAFQYENMFYLVQRRIRYLQGESFYFHHWVNDFDISFSNLLNLSESK